jgi:hypothetical protein
MAVFQKETGLCTGRGFSGVDANGYLAKFKAWVVKAGESGGPAWTILLDKSTLPVLTAFTVDYTTDIFTKSTHGMYTGDILQVSNSGGALPGGLSASTDYFVIKIDANTFYLATSFLNAQTGTVINITNNGSGTNSYLEIGPYIVISNESSPAINSSSAMIIRLGYRVSTAALVVAYYFLGFNTTTKALTGLWGGAAITTVDAGDFSYDFRGGAGCMIMQSRVGTTWYNMGIDGWTGDSNFVEGTDKTGTLASETTAGSNKVLQLGAGKASNFTVNKHYYIYDMNGHGWVDYVKVTARDTDADTITVDLLTYAYPTGAVIAAYAHRWYTFGSSTNSAIPYTSGATQTHVFHSQVWTWGAATGSRIIIELPTNIITRLNPDDDGYQACSKGLLLEYSDWGFVFTGMNRAYGAPNSVYMCFNNSMAAALDGKTIGGVNYLFFLLMSSEIYNGAGYAFLILDSTSTS